MATNKMVNYKKFLKTKKFKNVPTGLKVKTVNNKLFDWQANITKWSLKRGRACIFADCGLGKTPMQLTWADEVRKAKGDVLIVAPLAVSSQTIKQGNKFNVNVKYSRSGKKSKCGITITNYEMLHTFNPSDFAGIVLDESSILKSYTGKYRNQIIQNWRNAPFRLACTATPAPNDLMELGNHSEFVGAMSRTEMLSMFFTHSGDTTQKWRLKGHAKNDFWKWVCDWAVMVRKPSDLGYDNNGFDLPPLRIKEITVKTNRNKTKGMLYPKEAKTLSERQRARKQSVQKRCKKAAKIANSFNEPCLIWCNRNDESKALAKLINNCKEIKGTDKLEYKEKTMLGFSNGNVQKIVTKPSIAGWGMNWQHCNKALFVGLSDSYEQFYQSIRRIWRFGQQKPVTCYVIISEIEGAVARNIKRKEKQAQSMAKYMVKNMHVINEANIKGLQKTNTKYKPNSKIVIPDWLRASK